MASCRYGNLDKVYASQAVPMNHTANDCNNGLMLKINTFWQKYPATTIVHSSFFKNLSHSEGIFTSVLNDLIAIGFNSAVNDTMCLYYRRILESAVSK